MVHKIQTGNNYFLSLEVKTIKGAPCLCITKGASVLTFNHAETKQINTIVQSIDAENFTLKEYGSVKKGSEIFRIGISEFRGMKNFQIRERVSSPTYSGYGKLGIALPSYKLKELQMHLKSVMQEF